MNLRCDLETAFAWTLLRRTAYQSVYGACNVPGPRKHSDDPEKELNGTKQTMNLHLRGTRLHMVKVRFSWPGHCHVNEWKTHFQGKTCACSWIACYVIALYLNKVAYNVSWHEDDEITEEDTISHRTWFWNVHWTEGWINYSISH